MTSVTINDKKVLCNNVTISGNKNLDVKPNANIDGPVEAQTLAYENLTIVMSGVKFPFTTEYLDDTTMFQYSDLMSMYINPYDGTDAYSLKINLGQLENSPELITGCDLTNTTDIKVVLSSWNFPISATNSRNGYIPEATLTFKETK